MVSEEVAYAGYKVVLGGQRSDELFGGYARLIGYFAQCLKVAIEGTTHAGNFVVTYESITPNLATLRNHRPLLQGFWSDACSTSSTPAGSG
jgi:asparagine synthase (glutamine-hydrolysing)